MSKTISPSEVSAHSSPEKGMYIIIDGNVYDVTNFIDEHPGGAKILKRVAGKDASSMFSPFCFSFACFFFSFFPKFKFDMEKNKKTNGGILEQFWKYHNEGVLKKYSARLKIGTVGEKAKL